MTREELLRSKEYVVAQIQLGLLNLIGKYKKEKKLKDFQLADELKVSKGYISQLLNVTFDHKISKVVDLALSCNAMPVLHFVNLDEYIENDLNGSPYCLMPMNIGKNITLAPMHTVGSTAIGSTARETGIFTVATSFQGTNKLNALS